ncbi:MAG: helicase C-terminal domain-containing protein [Thermodesulfobacteriota bacterium]
MGIEPFSTKIKEEIGSHIKDAEGNEVFFVGNYNEEGIIDRIKVFARGNEYSVPAIIESAKSGDVVIHNHPSGNLTPSEQDIRIATLFGNHGVGFYIVDNDVDKVYVVVEPFKDFEIKRLDISELRTLLLPTGDVSRCLESSYEHRDEQLKMLENVSSAFNNDLISLIEAGTGTGKTLAYLLPSVFWSLKNGERVVLSTNTINLQEQLSLKDIPLVHESLSGEFKHSLVKGMGNYLCLLRAETISDGILEFSEDDEIDILKDILEWSNLTQDGSLSDLNFTPPENIWDKVSAESESCLHVKCPYYSKCFFYKARREVASSQIIVANHHLVFSDLAIKRANEESEAGILPPFKRIVFDEAHHIVDAATSHFGMRATKYGILRTLRRLKRKGSGGEVKGLISYSASVTTNLKRYFKKGILSRALRRIDVTLSPQIDALDDYITSAFDELYYFLLPLSEQKEGVKNEINMRITKDILGLDGWGGIESKFSILGKKLKDLLDEIISFMDVISDHESETDFAKIIVEFRGIGNKINYYAEVISNFLNSEEDGYVRWVEGRMGKGGVLAGIGLSPLDISLYLKERLYSSSKTIVMTSATMAVGGGFDFLKKGLGLMENERLEEHILPSSFNYMEQTLLMIPTDLPEPIEADYSTKISPIIFDAIKISDGNALILFTSYSLLEAIYSNIRQGLIKKGIVPLKQGSLPRNRLLEKFREEDKTVLFATDSFWEGIDVPGEALRLVIITRLPFKVPTDPIIEARVEHMERLGINSFLEYTVPVAVLKFKQGFGRLIRSRSDKGAVLVLDNRIVNKFYGKYFLDSLPECNRFIGKSREVIKELETFFNSKE